MKKLTVLACSWRSPHLLRPWLRSLSASLSVEAEILVVLNEGDPESIRLLCEANIPFVRLPQNRGHSAIDYALPMIQGEYVANVNDDMLFHPGWDTDLIDVIGRAYPASASSCLVEPMDTGNPAAVVDDLGSFEQAQEKFTDNVRAGKYQRVERIGYNHPIMVRKTDFVQVGGYSDNLDLNWYPGFGLDDYFAWRLWKLHEEEFRHVVSGRSFVYHTVAQTSRKIPESERIDPSAYFEFRTGQTLSGFRQRIQVNSLLPGR